MIEELSTTTTKKPFAYHKFGCACQFKQKYREQNWHNHKIHSQVGELKHFSMKLEHKDDKNYMYT